MKLIEKIKELWAKIVAWVKGASSVVDDFILKYAPIAVTVVNVIKEFNESDTMDIIEKILGTVASKRNRYLNDASFRFRGHHARQKGFARICDHTYSACYLPASVRYSLGAAEAASDRQKNLRGCAGPRLSSRSGVFQGCISADSARHRFGRNYGVYSFA